MRRDRLTSDDLRVFLYNNNIHIRNNEITHELTVDGEFSNTYNFTKYKNKKAELFYLRVYDFISADYDCTQAMVRNMLDLMIFDDDCIYNPVELILDSVPYDGDTDYLAELYDILSIPIADELSRTLIKKWLLQCIALSQNTLNDPFGADGMLVLQGKQGIGKTSLVRKLGINSELCKTDTIISEWDKDTKINALSAWITELGEIEKTVNSTSAEMLKTLITTAVDRYRVPWGKKTEAYPRMTSLVGTCNNERFLTDETGSRRFWVVPLERIDLKRLDKFDVLSMWKQIEHIYLAEGKDCFRLTAHEQYLLQKRNVKHEVAVSEDEIEDILSEAELYPSEYEMTWLTPTAFKSLYRSLGSYDSRKIGRVLKKLEVKEKRTGKGRFYLLPKPKNAK